MPADPVVRIEARLDRIEHQLKRIVGYLMEEARTASQIPDANLGMH